jgi:hypothetical protein
MHTEFCSYHLKEQRAPGISGVMSKMKLKEKISMARYQPAQDEVHCAGY